ncbi:MAG: hypothetical protein HY760_01720 [Nitrospirae bacterium]|nr:hypothetical protein [Nitrospirota bacterium]
MMKRWTVSLLWVAVLGTFGFSQAAFGATTAFNDYPYVYKGVRSLGMGGAFTAVGKDAEALFYNPAGLYEMGFQLQLLNPQAEVGTGVTDIAQDVLDAMDLETEQERSDALFDLVQKNQGTPLHLRFSLFPHVAVKNVAVGVLGQGRGDVKLHSPLSSAGAVALHGGYEYGPVAGFSLGLPVTGLRVGLGGKFISRTWVNKNFTIADIAAESFDFEQEKIEQSDMSFDLGVLYDLPVLSFLNPKVGLAMVDITDLDFDTAGKIPQRVNLGVSINPSVPVLASLIVALDYQDVSGAYEQDSSFGKRVHTGVEAGFLRDHIRLRAGLNQGYRAFGVGIDLWVLKLDYANYQEEIGAYAGQDKDERQVVQLTIGW